MVSKQKIFVVGSYYNEALKTLIYLYPSILIKALPLKPFAHPVALCRRQLRTVIDIAYFVQI